MHVNWNHRFVSSFEIYLHFFRSYVFFSRYNFAVDLRLTCVALLSLHKWLHSLFLFAFEIEFSLSQYYRRHLYAPRANGKREKKSLNGSTFATNRITEFCVHKNSFSVQLLLVCLTYECAYERTCIMIFFSSFYMHLYF